jgi:hypothetical protein
MDSPAEYGTEVRRESGEVYEPPILEEVGEFAALTGLHNVGHYADAGGYYDL